MISLPGAAPLALLTPTEMSRADRWAVAGGVPVMALMENAGRAVAAQAAEIVPANAAIAVLCGPGNNGGDGFVAARLLAERGFSVRVFLLGARAALRGEAGEAARLYQGEIMPAAPEATGKADLIVDALFGAGLDRPLLGEAAALVAAINTARTKGAKVLAVDLPSGIHGGSGAVLGTAVKADHTVSFFRAKPGHFLLPGREHVGQLTLAPIGIADEALTSIAPRTFLNAPALWREHWPHAAVEAHKYSRGAALCISGDAPSSGAIRLAAAAALYTGAGIVTVAAPSAAVPVVAAYRAAFVVKRAERVEEIAPLLADPRLGALLLGPGLGLDARGAQMLEAALATRIPLVLDADALTLIARQGEPMPARLSARGTLVLTPHEGEFARLFPDCRGSKLERAREAARRAGTILVLKGPDTVIAAPDGAAVINANAPPALATAGSGDVLAGIITGLLAAGTDPFRAAMMGVYLHGLAGQEAGSAFLADDLLIALRAVMRRAPPDFLPAALS